MPWARQSTREPYGAGLSISSNGGTAWTNYTTANGLGSDRVFRVFATDSAIYAATTGGLSIAVIPAPGAIVMLATAGLLGRRRRA